MSWNLFEINRNIKKHHKLLFMLILLISSSFCLIYFFQTSNPREFNTNIQIKIPNTLNLSFYNDDNTTLLFQNNYSLYLLMISGFEGDSIQINHLNHFINQELLAYFLDISLYNMSYLKNEYLFNSKWISWSFKYDFHNEFYHISAFDFSIYNGTNNYNNMDFGNNPFLNLTLKSINHIYVNEISCFHETGNIYRPYLNITYNNVNYLERMAWNNTISI